MISNVCILALFDGIVNSSDICKRDVVLVFSRIKNEDDVKQIPAEKTEEKKHFGIDKRELYHIYY
jgi:hypothetical protein